MFGGHGEGVGAGGGRRGSAGDGVVTYFNENHDDLYILHILHTVFSIYIYFYFSVSSSQTFHLFWVFFFSFATVMRCPRFAIASTVSTLLPSFSPAVSCANVGVFPTAASLGLGLSAIVP